MQTAFEREISLLLNWTMTELMRGRITAVQADSIKTRIAGIETAHADEVTAVERVIDAIEPALGPASDDIIAAAREEAAQAIEA